MLFQNTQVQPPLPHIVEASREPDSLAIFNITHADFARAARRQRKNAARYLNPLVIALLMSLVFGVWVFYRWVWQPEWFDLLSLQLVEAFDLFEFGSTMTLAALWGTVFWQRYQRKRNPILTVDTLYALSPYDFEHFTAQVFRKKGYNVTLRGRSGDAGVDLEVRQSKDNKRAIVQCKRYRKTLGPETIRELYGTMLHERVAHAFLVTTADITDGAKEWAKNKPLTLIDGKMLVQIAHELKLSL